MGPSLLRLGECVAHSGEKLFVVNGLTKKATGQTRAFTMEAIASIRLHQSRRFSCAFTERKVPGSLRLAPEILRKWFRLESVVAGAIGAR